MNMFGNRLKSARTTKGFTLEGLATLLKEKYPEAGINKGTLSKYENGKQEPMVSIVKELADVLNVTTDYLIGTPFLSTNQTVAPESSKSVDSMIDISGMIPIVGKIPAGYPVLAQENIEGYMPTMVNNPDEYFYLRVVGVSMINAGISSGSLVLIHKQPCAENGEIVACRVNGDEATLKRFKPVDKNTVVLMPENPDFQPIIVSTNDFNSGYAEIIGVAKQVIINL